MNAQEILAVMDHHVALKRIAYDHPTDNADANAVRESVYRKAVEARTAVASLIAERDALLEALKDCADRLEIRMKHSEDLLAHMKAVATIAKATRAQA